MLSSILYNTPMTLVIIASIWGIMCFRQLPPSLRALVLLLCFDAIMESTGSLLQYFKRPNLFLFPIVIVGEAGLMLLLYTRALQSAWLQRVAPWIVGFLTAYALLDTLLVPGTVRFRPSLQVMSDLLSLYLGGMYFRKQLNELQVARLERDPLFWISAGLVLTSLGNLLISLFSNYLLLNYSQQFNIYIWRIHTVFVGLLYTCYCIALWLRPAKALTAEETLETSRSTW
ncbi:hypothetical protein FNT36_10300 [Hymenobacter setariae]|uniref:Uncharacterized protein n=1 Tax=Hymenobacter setariae TaxID=2594794 RepID=A0A558BZ67_9BACT|nr:hypothetical protein [Hymenobacter setariae]TVT41804.1 hypothetical protein FNT36_10300 [Hymenobacter setariae]